MQSVSSTTFSDDAYVYEVKLNYLERIRRYDPAKRKFTDIRMEATP